MGRGLSSVGKVPRVRQALVSMLQEEMRPPLPCSVAMDNPGFLRISAEHLRAWLSEAKAAGGLALHGKPQVNLLPRLPPPGSPAYQALGLAERWRQVQGEVAGSDEDSSASPAGDVGGEGEATPHAPPPPPPSPAKPRRGRSRKLPPVAPPPQQQQVQPPAAHKSAERARQ